MSFRPSLAALLLVLAAAPASAHQIWIEADGQGVQVYFGEFGENLREVSPGLLDKLAPSARAVSPAGELPLKVDKGATSFAVSGPLPTGASIVAQDARYPAFERKRDGLISRGIYVPAARLVSDTSPQPAVLDLDIVPTGPGAFQVFFKGKPLAKAKVSVMTQSGWEKELHSDADGKVSTTLPWRGTYVLETKHEDKAAGNRGEDAYDSASYVTTLTIVQPQGVEPLPAPPPAKPN
ncbi:DUF4198 domain-containing protein [Reyranella sp.]|uniref:DUF4198 domain-containing protein n=1 Tax=Reyranella sp. TaxID=1929291 RepID=UPI003784F89A